MEEKQFEVELNDGKKETISLKSAVYEGTVADGKFVRLGFCPSFPPRIICIWLSVGEPVIIMFEADNDGIYRVVLDINLMRDGVISIEKAMKDGSSRRTDVKICY